MYDRLNIQGGPPPFEACTLYNHGSAVQCSYPLAVFLTHGLVVDCSVVVLSNVHTHFTLCVFLTKELAAEQFRDVSLV